MYEGPERRKRASWQMELQFRSCRRHYSSLLVCEQRQLQGSDERTEDNLVCLLLEKEHKSSAEDADIALVHGRKLQGATQHTKSAQPVKRRLTVHRILLTTDKGHAHSKAGTKGGNAYA